MKITVTPSAKGDHVAFDGVLDERFALHTAGLAAKLGAKPITFDCERIARINSPGVQMWCAFLDELPAKATYEFVRCPQGFVDYVNLIGPFRGKGQVATVVVPYRCANCGTRKSIETPASAAVRDGGFPEQACDRCKQSLAAEVPSDEYLAFVG